MLMRDLSSASYLSAPLNDLFAQSQVTLKKKEKKKKKKSEIN